MSVRRRRPETITAIPEQYARFVRYEWPADVDNEAAIEMWHAERSAWAREHESEFLGYITTPIGDWLDRLREKREAWLINCTVPNKPEDENW